MYSLSVLWPVKLKCVLVCVFFGQLQPQLQLNLKLPNIVNSFKKNINWCIRFDSETLNESIVTASTQPQLKLRVTK